VCLSVKVNHPKNVLNEGKIDEYEWAVTSNGMGFRCGYIRVPAGHPWHGKDELDIDANVHGGLTFSAADMHCGREGAAEDGFWFGFDCAHYGDAPDPAIPSDNPVVARSMERGFPGTIRTQEYVEQECRNLIEQAKEAARGQ
jgi:hypothetical protein